MNTQIKFRAWDKVNNRMIIVQQLYYPYWVCGYVEHGECDITLQMDKFYLMQFTGLQDRTGKYIYDGDILKIIDPDPDQEIEWISKVKFTNAHFAIKIPEQEYEYMSLGHAVDYEFEFEIIGNIYENPGCTGIVDFI